LQETKTKSIEKIKIMSSIIESRISIIDNGQQDEWMPHTGNCKHGMIKLKKNAANIG
jgi:hypothetical protein